MSWQDQRPDLREAADAAVAAREAYLDAVADSCDAEEMLRRAHIEEDVTGLRLEIADRELRRLVRKRNT